MAPIPPPELPPKTVLDSIAWYFVNLGGAFRAKSASIKDIWLIGTHLHSFFNVVANFLEGIGYKFNEVDELIRDILRKLDWVVKPESIRDVLDSLAGVYKQIREDPTGFVRDTFKSISGSMEALINNPFGFVDYYLRKIKTWLPRFLDENDLWFTGRLGDLYDWWSGFVTDRFVTVGGWVKENLPFLAEIDFNAPDWILRQIGYWYSWFRDFLNYPANTIYNWLAGIRTNVRDLLADPPGFVKSIFSQFTGWSYWEMANIPQTVFNRIVSNLVSYVSYVQATFEQAVCDVIMLFM